MDSVGRITEMAQKEDEKQDDARKYRPFFSSVVMKKFPPYLSRPLDLSIFISKKKEKEKSRVSRGKKKDSNESSYEKAKVREAEKLDAKFGDKYFFPKDEDTKFAREFEFY